jgi:N-acetylneuraminate synthase
MNIGACRIGLEHRPCIVAEMSGNHNQSLDRALEIVRAAAASGAHALKIQTYTPDSMTLNLSEREFFISNENSLWKGTSLYQLYQQACTPYDWHKPIFDECRRLGLLPFSTPFDEEAVGFLETLGVEAYKVASFENTDLPLIRHIARTGKPIIISTGMATVGELDEAVRTVRSAGASNVILLKCTSSYPATPEHSHIMTLPHLRDLFDCEVGLSDHTLGIGVAIAAIPLGAVLIEKHFTLARGDGGVDSAFSLEPAELKALVEESERAWQSLGTVSYGPTEIEVASMQFRRSLYVAEDMKAGEPFTAANLRRVRPGLGLSPKYFDQFLGKKVSRDVKKGTPVTWDLL